MRIFHFGPDQIQIFPAVIGPERSRERGEKRRQNRTHSQARVRPERIGRARGRGGGEKCDRDHNDNGHDLDAGQENLDGSAEPHAQIVHAGHDENPQHSERLCPGEDKIVGLEPSAEAGDGDVHGE